MMRSLIVFLTCSLMGAPFALAQQSRGELLYTTHCIACHTTDIHWRDMRLVSDWPGLKDQVRRWQSVVSLSWRDSDIADVSRYLNDTIYHFEQTADRMSSAGKAGGAPFFQGLPPERVQPN